MLHFWIAISVRLKAVPFARSGSPETLASAKEKQSPELSPAGCRPLPYLRQAEGARSACSRSTGTISILARTRKRSNSRPAFSPCRPSRTIPVSSPLAADISRLAAAVMAWRKAVRSGSAKKVAASADVSITINAAARVHRSQRFRQESENPELATDQPGEGCLRAVSIARDFGVAA
jgi:hypothetical protein